MGCEPSCECQESNPGPLREQPELLATEPSHNLFFGGRHMGRVHMWRLEVSLQGWALSSHYVVYRD